MAPMVKDREEGETTRLIEQAARGDQQALGKLLGRMVSASEAADRADKQIRLQEALNTLDPFDREILALRHFEELSNGEVAELLGIQKAAASKRYVRALKRLREILDARPGGLGGL